MRRFMFIYFLLALAFVLYVVNYNYRDSRIVNPSQEGLRGSIDEKYVMVTFQAGIEYWKSGLKGFEDAAETMNVSVEYRGATQYDLHEQITVLEQVIARKPAGIALSAINPQELSETINKAVEAGIPVVLFDSGAITSKAYSFLATNNYSAGVTAAHKMAELLQNKGELAIITQPNQLNHQERTKGFQDTIEKEYPQIKIAAVEDGKGDQAYSSKIAAEIMKDHPNVSGFFATQANGAVGIGETLQRQHLDGKVKLIGFDTDKSTLDMIKTGVVSATMAQGTWQMGYWSLQFLFQLKHGLLNPAPGSEVSPLPPYVDTGITVVTERNVDNYYAK
ncbi:substrate-binding domain-containing protein [Paenibacillus rigui]|uniref:LacI family transcriptional regulator n=1 Tax=Paenibacillus rigui TaxID=554312 RepID=A0A229UKV1_9BACL|nr:substrate-binding domain-containing protein [Paenibacillus rigui]OXM83539.1 LacI family transcriptional regulator [Paenibacillus rigui]